MAAINYDESLRRLLADEGGYTNHPSDPGGPTNFGITIADYRKYVRPGATAADVRAMKLSEAKQIYRAKYWDAQSCDKLPSGVDYAIFDYGVNSGIGRSGKVLRRVLGLPDNTSVVTADVIAAAIRRDPRALAAAICDERLAFLQRLKTWPTFGKGWGRRVVGVKAASFKMIERQPTLVEPRAVPAPGKGVVPEPNVAKKIIIAGGGTAAVVHGGLWHWVGTHPGLTIALALAVVGLVVWGLALLKRHHREQQEAPTLGIPVVPATLTGEDNARLVN